MLSTRQSSSTPPSIVFKSARWILYIGLLLNLQSLGCRHAPPPVDDPIIKTFTIERPTPRAKESVFSPAEDYYIIRALDKHYVDVEFNSKNFLRWPNPRTAALITYLKARYQNINLQTLRVCGVANPSMSTFEDHLRAHSSPSVVCRVDTTILDACVAKATKKSGRLTQQVLPLNADQPVNVSAFDLALETAPKTISAAATRDLPIAPAAYHRAAQWAQVQLSPESLMAMQRLLQLPATGTFNEETALAVFRLQRIWNPKETEPGKLRYSLFYKLGMIPTAPLKRATVNATTYERIKNHAGVTLLFRPKYDAGIKGSYHLTKAAADIATNYSDEIIGVDSSNEINFGIPTDIENLSNVLEYLTAIKLAIPDIRIKNIGIVAHGLIWALGLNRGSYYFYRSEITGLQNCAEDNCVQCSTDPKNDQCRNIFVPGTAPSNVHEFSNSIATLAGSKVRLLLFACMTGANPQRILDEGRDSEWHDDVEIDEVVYKFPSQGIRRGLYSLAHQVALELGNSATVIGHMTPGEAVENYASVVFGSDGIGNDGGGIHMFDIVFSDEYIRAELNRMQLSSGEYNRLRAQMWDHYMCNVRRDRNLLSNNARKSCSLLRTEAEKRPSVELYLHLDEAIKWFHDSWESRHKIKD